LIVRLLYYFYFLTTLIDHIQNMPRVLITGGAGLIGPLLATRLLSDPSYEVILTDIISPPIPPKAKYPENCKPIQADLCDTSSLKTLIETSLPLDAVCIFHGIMSSGSEANFELGMKVNLHSTLSFLEALRLAHKPGEPLLRVLYASSQAVYGQPLPAVIDESVLPTPEGSYGAQKLCCETLLNDYTRKGYLDGYSLRFPTISVRGGKPTAAASSFLSGMIREPLNNQECVIPLKDRSFRSWLCSPKTLAENLVHALKIGPDALPRHKRVVNMPGIGVSVQDMMDALERVAGKEKLGFLREETDEGMERILRSWGTEFDNSLAYGLGFAKDVSFEQAVRDYVDSLKE
jgi:nucleoside-diphosphate-sugar epimerase